MTAPKLRSCLVAFFVGTGLGLAASSCTSNSSETESEDPVEASDIEDPGESVTAGGDETALGEDPFGGEEALASDEESQVVEAQTAPQLPPPLDEEEALPEPGDPGNVADHSPAAEVAETESGTYVVAPGDTLSKIASRIYGNAKEWKTLAILNKIINPALIHPGDRLTYPVTRKASVAFKSTYPENRKTVTVRPGESLSDVAQRVFGSSTYWRTLWKFNEETIPDPDLVMAGQKLSYLPGAAEDGGGEPLSH